MTGLFADGGGRQDTGTRMICAGVRNRERAGRSLLQLLRGPALLGRCRERGGAQGRDHPLLGRRGLDRARPDARAGVAPASMSRYFEEMRAVLERHGGTVEKFIGDAVMAVFGVPRLHEDDALRAVRAAVEMREVLAGLNEEFRRELRNVRSRLARASTPARSLPVTRATASRSSSATRRTSRPGWSRRPSPARS